MYSEVVLENTSLSKSKERHKCERVQSRSATQSYVDTGSRVAATRASTATFCTQTCLSACRCARTSHAATSATKNSKRTPSPPHSPVLRSCPFKHNEAEPVIDAPNSKDTPGVFSKNGFCHNGRAAQVANNPAHQLSPVRSSRSRSRS